MKKITIEEVAKQLSENVSIEFGEKTATYFFHMDEAGHPDANGSVFFTADLDISGYLGDEDMSRLYDDETLDNADFRNVCEGITKQANDWIAENM